MPIIIIYAFVFASVLILSDWILRRIFNRRKAALEVNERLARLNKRGDQLEAYNTLIRDRSLSGRGTSLLSPGGISRLYRQSGLTLTLRTRILYAIGILLLSILICNFLLSSMVLQIISSVVLWFFLTIFLIWRVRAKRIKHFVSQLPPAVEIIVRSLNAGHPLTAAIALVGREMPDPIGSEFGLLSDQLTFGSELDQAMLSMVDRVGADELNLLAVTVSVQRNTGGNLAEILENLSNMIRDRAMLRGKIRAISAEGRITAVIMAIFPLLLFLMIRTLVPTYFDPVWATGYGTEIVVGTLAFMSIGVFILNRLVSFDF